MSSSEAGRPRILVYCHNVHGLGHIVRSLHIAAELRPGERCACRLITGCRFLDHLDVDPRIEVVRLPALRPARNGRVEPVEGGPLVPVLQERIRRITEEVERWRPHVVLVDHNPLGLLGELTKILESSHKAGAPTRFIWGIRDIWGAPGYLEKMRPFRDLGSRVEHFHGAIAYTDDRWLDTFREYRDLGLPAHRRSVGFVTGRVPAASPPEPSLPPLITALSGGGAQAGDLLDLLLEAVGGALDRGELRLRFVIGPFTPEEPLRARAGGRPGVDLWPEGSVEQAVAGASLVVSRAGYNTAYTVVQASLPVVFIPLQAENREQSLRAARLAELAGVYSVEEADPRPAAALEEAVRRGLTEAPVARRLPFATDGARRAADWLLELAAEVQA